MCAVRCICVMEPRMRSRRFLRTTRSYPFDHGCIKGAIRVRSVDGDLMVNESALPLWQKVMVKMVMKEVIR